MFIRILLATSLLCILACSSDRSRAANTAADRPPDYNWTQVTERAAYPEGYNFPVYVAKSRMWAFHAEGIWSSADGKTWSRETLPSIRPNIYATDYVFLNDTVYALGDNSGNYENIRFKPVVKKTTDFRNWHTVNERTNLPGRIFRGSLAFNGKLWIFGGYDGRQFHNDVWSSPDGVRWTQVTKAAGWSPRSNPTVTVFGDRMLLIGGGVIDGTANPNPGSDREIWSSTDGATWTKLATDLQNRAGGHPIVFDGKLWLVGANRDGSFARSSLVSDNGVNWREVAAPWSPRGGATAWLFGDKLYMTGGKYSVTENGQIRFIYSNDVWMMERVAEK